jgi:phage baseplate assembly protein V
MWNKVESYINRAIARIRLPFRGVIGSVNSSGGVQLVNGVGLNGEVIEGAEYFQHYGFTSSPPNGAMKVVAPVGGRTAHSIIVATEHAAYRIKALKSGELAIYTDEGDSIIMNRGRVINLTTQTLNINASTAVNITTPTYTVKASEAVNLTTPLVNASENLSVSGVTAANGGMTAKAGASGGHAIDISGTANVSDDVVISGKSQLGHAHKDSMGGVTSGEL